MLKGEIEILAAIVLNKRTLKQLTTGRLARYSPYVHSTLESLRRKRYIVKHETKGYLITEKGIRALAEFYPGYAGANKVVNKKLSRKQADEVDKAIKMIEQLSSEYDIKIGELHKFQGKSKSA